jgi:hypothetical protein
VIKEACGKKVLHRILFVLSLISICKSSKYIDTSSLPFIIFSLLLV